MSQIIGNINVPADGTYAFRLISDDGSRLLIGDEKVIDHDGLHGAEPKDGEIALTPGYHPLRIDHFDRGGGQQVTLQWKPPGADDFALVRCLLVAPQPGSCRRRSRRRRSRAGNRHGHCGRPRFAPAVARKARAGERRQYRDRAGARQDRPGCSSGEGGTDGRTGRVPSSP